MLSSFRYKRLPLIIRLLSWAFLVYFFAPKQISLLISGIFFDSIGKESAYLIEPHRHKLAVEAVGFLEDHVRANFLDNYKSKLSFFERVDRLEMRLDTLAWLRKRNEYAGLVYLVIKHELGGRLTMSDVDYINSSRDSDIRLAADIYWDIPMTQQRFSKIGVRYVGQDFLKQLMFIHAADKIDPGNNRDAYLIQTRFEPNFEFGAETIVALAGIIVCSLLFIKRKTMNLKPSGFPLAFLHKTEQDKLVFILAMILMMVAYFQGNEGSYYLDSKVNSEHSINLLFIYVSSGLLAIVLLFNKFFRALFRLLDFRKNFKRNLIWGGSVALIALTIKIILGTFIREVNHFNSVDFFSGHDAGYIVVSILATTFGAAVLEEVVFRGIIFPWVSHFFSTVWLGAIISSLLFAFGHGYGPLGTLGCFSSGLLYCVATYNTRSLVPGIIAHALNNGFAVLFTYLGT